MVLFVALLAGCGASGAPPMEARSTLPAAIAPLVPQRGVYAAGGGLVSTPWRVVVDYDAKTLIGSRGDQQGGASFGALEHNRQRTLTDAELAEIRALADAAAREVAEPNPSPTADYDEIVVVADGARVYFHEGFGPIGAKAAAALVKRLQPESRD